MFWKCGPMSVSIIDTILDRPAFTLEEILDEDIVVQECRSQNLKLLNFLTKPETIEQLITYVVQDPDPNAAIEDQFMYANTACDILSSGVAVMSDAIISNTSSLDRLWSYLSDKHELHELLASFVCHIISTLNEKSPDEMLKYFKTKENAVDVILSKINLAAVSELLLRLLQRRDTTEQQNMMTWLREEEEIIFKCVSVFDSKNNKESHDNIGLCLTEILLIYVETNNTVYETDILIEDFKTTKVIGTILGLATRENKKHSAVTNSVEVLGGIIKTIILEKKKKALQAEDNDESYKAIHESCLKCIVPYLSKLKDILSEESEQPVRGRNPSIGQHRMKILQIFLLLLDFDDKGINKEIHDSGFLKTCLELFQTFHWNNVLHAIIEKILNNIIKEQRIEGEALFVSLINDCKLLDWIITNSELNDEDVKNQKGRRANMGHLLRIADTVNTTLLKPSHPIVTELNITDKWGEFVTGTVEIAKAINNKPLGDNRPVPDHHSEDNINLEDDAAADALHRYLDQQIADDLPDGFAMDDDDNNSEEQFKKYEKSSEFDEEGSFTPDTSEVNSLPNFSNNFAAPPDGLEKLTSKNDEMWNNAFESSGEWPASTNATATENEEWTAFGDGWESATQTGGDGDAWDPFGDSSFGEQKIKTDPFSGSSSTTTTEK